MDHVGGIVDHHGLLVARMQMPQRRLRGTRYSYWRTTEWRLHEKASFFADPETQDVQPSAVLALHVGL